MNPSNNKQKPCKNADILPRLVGCAVYSIQNKMNIILSVDSCSDKTQVSMNLQTVFNPFEDND